MKLIKLLLIITTLILPSACSTLRPIVEEEQKEIRFIAQKDVISSSDTDFLSKELNKIIYQTINENLKNNTKLITLGQKTVLISSFLNTKNKKTNKELTLYSSTLDINASYKDNYGLRSLDGYKTIPLMIGKFTVDGKTSWRFDREELAKKIKENVIDHWNNLTPYK